LTLRSHFDLTGLKSDFHAIPVTLIPRSQETIEADRCAGPNPGTIQAPIKQGTPATLHDTSDNTVTSVDTASIDKPTGTALLHNHFDRDWTCLD
jgi:hypothetical protein